MKNRMLFIAPAFLSALLAYAPPVAASPPAAPSPTPSPAASPSPQTAKSPGKPAIVLPPEKALPVRIPRFEKPPVIDGRLDDEVWKHAAVFKDFFQIQPGDNLPPSKPTEVLLGYDSKTLYVGFHAFDDPGRVRATVAKRDDIFDDDYVGLFFDTFNDRRKAYEMNFNPLGVQADGLMDADGNEDFTVDIVMESKGILTGDGYTVEVAIPFKSLRYEAGKGKLWGAHFYRRIKRFNNELDMWMPISRDNSSWLGQEGHITGLEGISTERTLELIPNITFSETGKRVRTIPLAVVNTHSGIRDPGRFVNPPADYEVGLTGKLGITPTVTLDFTINPDFAQIEADQTVITVNQRFPIFFPEKRPFFLEGKEIFETPLQAVHTRAIINPAYAAKLTGKRGRNTFGLLLAADSAPGDPANFTEDDLQTDPTLERFFNKKAYIGVLRLKRDFGTENSIGFLATSYNFSEKHSQLGGFDGRFRFDKQTTLSFQVLGSASRRHFFDPDQGQDIYRTGNGLAYSLHYEKNKRHLGYNFDGSGRTRDYRADVGFNRRLNTNREGFFIVYNSEPKPKARLISWRVYNLISTNFDWQGRQQNWVDEAQVQFRFRRQTFFGLGIDKGYERLFEEEFGAKRTPTRAGTFFGSDSERSARQKSVFAFAGSTPSKKYNFFVLGIYNWNTFDLDFGGGLKFPRVSPAALRDPNAPQDPGPGNEIHIESTFNYQPTDALRNTLSFTKDRLVRNDTHRLAFDDNIISVKSTYQFTRFIFARGRIDYDTLASNIKGQFLLGWAPNPGTAFYIGYNDDLNRNGFSPFTKQLEPGFRRNARTFFIKLSYLFRRSL